MKQNKKNMVIPITILLSAFIFSIIIVYICNMIKPKVNEYISKQTVDEKQEIVTVFVERKQMNSNNYSNIKLNVKNINQNPELPTGCEITSLAIVLNYLGHDVDKLSMADNFLPQGETGKTDPDIAFIGNPRDKHSYGANAPVLVNTANYYLTQIKSNYHAYDLTGKEWIKMFLN